MVPSDTAVAVVVATRAADIHRSTDASAWVVGTAGSEPSLIHAAVAAYPDLTIAVVRSRASTHYLQGFYRESGTAVADDAAAAVVVLVAAAVDAAVAVEPVHSF